MKVLRSRTIFPKPLINPVPSPTPTLQPSTPIKSHEHPISSPVYENLSASPCLLEPSPLGLGLPSTSQPAPRRSLRLALMYNGSGDHPSSADGQIDDPDPVSGSPGTKKRKFRFLSSSALKARVLDVSDSAASNVDIDLDSKEDEGADSQVLGEDTLCSLEGEVADRCHWKEKVLNGVEMGLGGDQAAKDGEGAGIQEDKKGLGEEASGSGCKNDSDATADGGKQYSKEENAKAPTTELGLGGDQTVKVGENAGIQKEEKKSLGEEASGSGWVSIRRRSERLADKNDTADGGKQYSKEENTKAPMIELGLGCGQTVKVGENAGIQDDEEKKRLGEEASDSGWISIRRRSERLADKNDSDAAAAVGKQYSKEEKAKALVTEEDCLSFRTEASKSSAEGNQSYDVCGTESKRMYTEEEKGKGKLIEISGSSVTDNEEKLGAGANDVESSEWKLLQAAFDLVAVKKINEPNIADGEAKQNVWGREGVVQMNKGRFLETAKTFASKFAHFEPNEEVDPVAEPEISMEESGAEEEDWPGPFSTAMHIIEERAAKLSARLESSSSVRCKVGSVIKWVPSPQNDDSIRLRPPVPSLCDLCIGVLCKNAEAITSLDGVPDALRIKLSNRLCDSRKMSHQLLRLFVSGCPSELHVKDCSNVTEEQFQEIFQSCNTEYLKLLMQIKQAHNKEGSGVEVSHPSIHTRY